MKFTEERPSEPGAYWVCMRGGRAWRPRIGVAEVERYLATRGQSMRVRLPNSDKWRPFAMCSRWLWGAPVEIPTPEFSSKKQVRK